MTTILLHGMSLHTVRYIWEANGSFLGSIYFSIHYCLPLLFLAGVPCVVIPAQEWDTAKLSSCTTRDSIVTRGCSGWHAAQLQVNTSRDSATAVPPLKYVFISPATPHAQSEEVCVASPLLHHVYPPIWMQPLSKLFTKAFLFAHHKWHSKYSISFLFLDTAIPAAPQCFLPSEWERNLPLSPPSPPE